MSMRTPWISLWQLLDLSPLRQLPTDWTSSPLISLASSSTLQLIWSLHTTFSQSLPFLRAFLPWLVYLAQSVVRLVCSSLSVWGALPFLQRALSLVLPFSIRTIFTNRLDTIFCALTIVACSLCLPSWLGLPKALSEHAIHRFSHWQAAGSISSLRRWGLEFSPLFVLMAS